MVGRGKCVRFCGLDYRSAFDFGQASGGLLCQGAGVATASSGVAIDFADSQECVGNALTDSGVHHVVHSGSGNPDDAFRGGPDGLPREEAFADSDRLCSAGAADSGLVAAQDGPPCFHLAGSGRPRVKGFASPGPGISLPFDDLGNLGRNHFLPTGIVFPGLVEDVPRENAKACFIVIQDLIDAATINEIFVEVSQFMGHPQIVDCQEFLAAFLAKGVDLELQVVLKESSERLQNSSVQLGVILLLKELPQTPDPHADPDHLVGEAPEIGRQAVVLEVV